MTNVIAFPTPTTQSDTQDRLLALGGLLPDIEVVKTVLTVAITGTDQTCEVTRLPCGCEYYRYMLPGHDSTRSSYPCLEHEDEE